MADNENNMTQVTEPDRASVYNAIRRFKLISYIVEKNGGWVQGPPLRRSLNAQILAEDFADNQVKAYAQQCCRELCAAMRSKLPRELRDMIYDHLLSPVPDEPYNLYDDSLDDASSPYRKIIAESIEKHGYAHMCSEDFVDLDTMSEFARRWYTHIRLKMHLTPTRVAEFFATDVWGLGLDIDGLLSHVEVEVCEKEDEDKATPLQCLLKLAPSASIVFHLRTEFITGNVDQMHDKESAAFLLTERVSELFPLMRQLIAAGYELYGALDWYEGFRVTTAILDRDIWKNTLRKSALGNSRAWSTRNCGWS